MGQSWYYPNHPAGAVHTFVELVVYTKEAGHSNLVVERYRLAEADIEVVVD
ncbi:hypothetical protein MCECM63_01591 [Methylophilaceae bacterium]